MRPRASAGTRPSIIASLAIVVALGITANVGHTQQRRGGTGAGAGRGNPQAASITGRVVNVKGLAVPETFVTALIPKPSVARGFQFFSAQLWTTTNERGEYRLEGLSLGEFLVIALPHNQLLDPAGLPNRAGYANTFYPAADAIEGAKRVVVKPGGAAIANITLAPARLSVVSGTVIAESGKPAGSVRLGLVHGDGLFGLDGRGTLTRPDGTFAISGLQPGTYHLRYIGSTWPPPRGEIPLVSGTTVHITGGDLPGVRVVPIHMVRATGRVIVSAADRPAFRPEDMTVAAAPVDFDGNPGPQRSGVVSPNLTFEFSTWPSVGKLRFYFASPGWAVESVSLGGVDVTDKPITFTEGKVVSGIEIMLRRQR